MHEATVNVVENMGNLIINGHCIALYTLYKPHKLNHALASFSGRRLICLCQGMACVAGQGMAGSDVLYYTYDESASGPLNHQRKVLDKQVVDV